MGQQETKRIAEELLTRMGAGADPDNIAALFSTNLEFEIAGKPNATLKAGDTFFIPPEIVHAAKNVGKGPAKLSSCASERRRCSTVSARVLAAPEAARVSRKRLARGSSGMDFPAGAGGGRSRRLAGSPRNQAS